MLEALLPYERELFFLINHVQIDFLDHFMFLVSNTLTWIPLFLYLVLLLLSQQGWKRCLPIFIAIGLVFLVCDQFSSSLCKPFFARLRPTHHPDFMNEVRTVYGYMGGRYGFLSSHAANVFGFATLTAFLLKGRLYACTIYIFAAIVACSRVYLGVHFISDIVAGSLAGYAIGMLLYLLYSKYNLRFANGSPQASALSIQGVKTLSILIMGYVMLILIYSLIMHPVL